MSAFRREYEIELAWASWRQTPTQWKAALRDRLAEAQNWRCCYLGCCLNSGRKCDAPTLEHIWPKSLGGEDVEDNFVVACAACNMDRGNEIWPVHIEALRIAGRIPING